MALAAHTIPRSTIALVGAAIAGRRPRNPYLRRDWLRVSQRLAAGMTSREVAHAERRDEATIQGLLAQDGFRELVASWEALAAKPPEQQTRGRDPAATLAKGVVTSSRRAARGSAAAPPAPADPPAPAGGPARPRSPTHPGDRMIERGAARLRRAVADEFAARDAATAAFAAETMPPVPPTRGAAATVTAAKRALALKHAAAGFRPAKAPACPPGSVTGPVVAGRRAGGSVDVAAAVPITGLPRRPRAP